MPYGEGITFWSLREIVSQLTTAGPTGELLADGHEARPLAESLQEAIGAAETSSDREEIFWATRSLFEALARERPLVVFFEDVHWAEPTFLDLVEYLAERVQGVPILLVCIARPELLEERPGWGRGKPNASSLVLERLPDPDCEALIANLARGLAQATRVRVLETADGNPLFIEQLVAMLTERGGDEAELPIPPTIAALLSARLDRLGPGERAVITRAAVVGKEFSAQAAVDLLPEDARRVRCPPHRDPGPQGAHRARAIAWTWRELPLSSHPDPAGRLQSDPQAGPRGASRALRHVDRRPRSRGGVAEHSEIVGYHLEQAFRYRAELGAVGEEELELARRAGDHLASAGQRAFQRGDMPATVNLLGRAASLSSSDGDAGLRRSRSWATRCSRSARWIRRAPY